MSTWQDAEGTRVETPRQQGRDGSARCRECGKRITIKKDGGLRAHNGNEYDGIWGIRCDGSGTQAEVVR